MVRFTPRAVLLVAGACFIALAAAVWLLPALPADAAVRDTLLGLASPGVIAAMRLANHAGAWPVLLPGAILLFLVFPEARRRWWVWVGLMAVTPSMERLLKVTIGRPRPESSAYGFPSGHATAAAAFFGAVIYLSAALPPTARRLVRALALAAIALVGIARIMLHAHWPSDVLGGIALGLALASVAALAAASPLAGGPRQVGERHPSAAR